MKTWLIASIMIAVLIAGAICVSALVKSPADNNSSIKQEGCGSCAGKCTADNNCGLSSCSAVSSGTACGCGKG